MLEIKKQSLSETFSVYLDRRMFRILLLGAISGFPWVLIGSSLSLWLKEEGLSRSTIGWAGLIFAVYMTFKQFHKAEERSNSVFQTKNFDPFKVMVIVFVVVFIFVFSKGIEVLNPWEIPFLNTVILLTSGASVTWAHHAILAGERSQAIWSLVVTVMLATVFTGLQVMEYIEAPFTITDGIYGSTFYLATGFHGFHVFVGTIFLLVCLVRVFKMHFTKQHHFGFEAAAWYWHFVDVVWLFLFVAIYWWGGN